jgi:hypothetical protein
MMLEIGPNLFTSATRSLAAPVLGWYTDAATAWLP